MCGVCFTSHVEGLVYSVVYRGVLGIVSHISSDIQTVVWDLGVFSINSQLVHHFVVEQGASSSVDVETPPRARDRPQRKRAVGRM